MCNNQTLKNTHSHIKSNIKLIQCKIFVLFHFNFIQNVFDQDNADKLKRHTFP